MANIELNPMEGGKVVLTETLNEVEIEHVKLLLGDVGDNDGPVSAGNPMPTDMNLGGDPVTEDNPVPVEITNPTEGKDFLTSGNGIYTTVGGDFVATPTVASKNIVLSVINETLLTTLALETFSVAVIKKISSAGVVSDLPVSTIAWDDGTKTVTLTDMDPAFVTGDKVSMILLGPDRGMWQRLAGENVDEQVQAFVEKAMTTTAYGYDLVRGFTSGTYQLAKNAPGTTKAVVATSKSSALRYLLILDRASAPSGSTNVIDSYPLPPGSENYPTMLALGDDILKNYGHINGIVFAISTADMSYTAATAADHTLRSYVK